MDANEESKGGTRESGETDYQDAHSESQINTLDTSKKSHSLPKQDSLV